METNKWRRRRKLSSRLDVQKKVKPRYEQVLRDWERGFWFNSSFFMLGKVILGEEEEEEDEKEDEKEEEEEEEEDGEE